MRLRPISSTGGDGRDAEPAPVRGRVEEPVQVHEEAAKEEDPVAEGVEARKSHVADPIIRGAR